MGKDNRLAFLDFIVDNRLEQYQKSKWLQSDFDSIVWHFDYGKKGNLIVDFNIRIADGSLLTDDKNYSLLKTFKYWLNVCTHNDATRGRGNQYSDSHARQQVICVLTIIDFFLINDQYLNVSTCGLTAISEDNIKQLLHSLSLVKEKAESIYSWSLMVSKFLMEQVAQSNTDELNNIISETDIDLEFISDEQKEKNTLSIPLEYIPLVRAWLLKNDLLYCNARTEYELRPKTLVLSKKIYKNTLRGGVSNKPLPEILCAGQDGVTQREKPMICTQSEENENIHNGLFNQYKSSLKSLRLLYDTDLNDEKLALLPIQCFQVIDKYQPTTATSKRFMTLPLDVAFYSIRQAIEFHLKYGVDLVDSYKCLLAYLRKNNRKLKRVSSEEFKKLMHPKINELGVQQWSIYQCSRQTDYFEMLRSNQGLSELIRVYFGATAIVVGALMARRQAELILLKCGECIDSSGQYLIFEKAKSTVGISGIRSTVARPIEDIAVEMIRLLEEFQNALLDSGYIETRTNLFSPISFMNPTCLSSVATSHHQYNRSLDLFCDYFETPKKNGDRYYIRQHQLRRFFAMSFFWGSGFSGLDTLRWFLGHTDPEHLYHYITESCTGEVLNSVKAQYATETIESHANLSELIKLKYNVDDFTILEESELQEFINDLIEDGDVEVEPEYFEDEKGKQYKIIIKVTEVVNAEG